MKLLAIWSIPTQITQKLTVYLPSFWIKIGVNAAYEIKENYIKLHKNISICYLWPEGIHPGGGDYITGCM